MIINATLCRRVTDESRVILTLILMSNQKLTDITVNCLHQRKNEFSD